MAAGSYLGLWESESHGMMGEEGVSLETLEVMDTRDAITTAFEALQVRNAADDIPTAQEYVVAGARIPWLRADILALPQYAVWLAAVEKGDYMPMIPMRGYVGPSDAADAVFHILRFTERVRKELLEVGKVLTTQHNYVLDIHDYVRRTFEDGLVFFNT